MTDTTDTAVHRQLNEQWIGYVNEMIAEGNDPRVVTEAMALALTSALIQTHGSEDAWKTAFAVYAPLRHAAGKTAPAETIN